MLAYLLSLAPTRRYLVVTGAHPLAPRITLIVSTKTPPSGDDHQDECLSLDVSIRPLSHRLQTIRQLGRPADESIQRELRGVVVDHGPQLLTPELGQGLVRLQDLDRQPLGLFDAIEILRLGGQRRVDATSSKRHLDFARLVLFFIHVGTRRVQLAGMSARPNSAWIAEQARGVAPAFGGENDAPMLLLRDFDGKFTKEFDDFLQTKNIAVKKVGPRKPNQNAFAERWVQSVQQECLDRFVVFGEDHLRHIVSQYVEHYNVERPHQARDNLPLGWVPFGGPPDHALVNQIVCDERLGGLLKHYRRAG